MRQSFLSLIALLTGLPAAAGCSELADGDYKPAYGTIRGQITAVSPPDDEVRLALSWLTVQEEQGAFQIAEDVAVGASFPTSYEIDVNQLPPEGAIQGFIGEEGRDRAEAAGLDPDMRWAQAVILAYTDGDDDGHLDVSDQDGASPDHVIGKAEDVTIWWLDEGAAAPAPDHIGSLPVGEALTVTRAPLVDPLPGDCAADVEGEHHVWPCAQIYSQERALLPLPATVDLSLTFDSHLDHYTCSLFWGSEEWPDWASDWNQSSPLAGDLCSGPACDCEGTGCPLDLPPPDTEVTCNEDGTAYTYKRCVDDPDLCGTRFCHYGHGERSPDDPVPAGWPCP